MPVVTFGQTAPTLGTAASFVLFTTNGSMTNAGTKYLTLLKGNVGSNLAGTNTGFGNVNGVMHDYDTASGQCTTDVLSLDTQLTAAIPTFHPVSPLLGNGDTLVAGVYQYPLLTAASLNSNLVLNPNSAKLGSLYLSF
jgi:anaerobic selenocysteine-containing dehydrogenase